MKFQVQFPIHSIHFYFINYLFIEERKYIVFFNNRKKSFGNDIAKIGNNKGRIHREKAEIESALQCTFLHCWILKTVRVNE